MSVVAATAGYDKWLAAAVGGSLDPSDRRHKRRLLADPADPFPFFRGTYYRWVQRWAAAAGPLADAPRVLAVGDLHVENFGTWRDADARLCWGVNDFDEADDLPYTQDLVRLAASVRLARVGGGLRVRTRPACAALLAGYVRALSAGGRHFVLEERHPQLRAMAVAADREPPAFWAKLVELLDLPEADLPADARELLAASLPARGLVAAFRPRPKAGVGSLGRPRFVALARWSGGWVCREAKAAAPPATAWAAGVTGRTRAAEAVGRAVRAADPFYAPGDRWVVRRLAPHCSRIELPLLARADAGRLLRAMGAETANVHLGTPGAAGLILADLARQPDGWLATAARESVRRVVEDWAAWRAAVRGR